MNTYSVVHVYRGYEDGELHRFTLPGMTYLSLEDAYQWVMDARRDYTPEVRTSRVEVVENAITPGYERDALGYMDRLKWDAVWGVRR